ncbi:MAG: bifunctional folylpolyglutamate synthase/dihydrofolate synthase [Fibrobacterota bacterium]|nr:MAG: bifunctional folylpolyglutamate synthase/dihydrofolate synthase [Fibrobacterota bacterium]
MLDRLGNPQVDLRGVHVAGTNGKGSTCRMLHRLLSRAGLTTGLFTSPHLVCVRERFVIGEEAISETEFVEIVDQVHPFAVDTGATYFEMLTAMGAVWFARRGVDAVVLETGLGGRLDSTTALPAQVCVVAQVGLDHCAILGDTVEKIWAEKIAIARVGKPLVTLEARPALVAALARLSRERDVEIVRPEVDSEPVPGLPSGPHQLGNFALARAAAELFLGRKMSSVELAESLHGMRWPGRWERIDGTPVVILDVGHNPDAAQALSALASDAHPVVVYGTASDKDWKSVMECLSKSAAQIHLVPLPVARGEGPLRIASLFPDAIAHGTFAEGWGSACRQARELGVPVLACGSFHLVGQAVRALTGEGRYGVWPRGIVPDPALPGMG